MSDSHSLQQKVVLITGAGRGIGKRLAIGYASRGAHVGLLARSKTELDLTQMEIEHAGGSSMRLLADVRVYPELAGAVDLLRDHFGPVDILVCAAAIQGPIGSLANADPAALADTIQTNLVGVIHCCRAVLPGMIERRSGKIIVLSGGGAANARPNFSAYAASKGAVVRFVESLAEEVREHNVQVNCMAPGGTYSNMTDEILRAGDRAGWKEIENASQIRITGGVSPEKQIHLALFLSCERSNHISGKLIHVNDDWRKLEHSNINPELFTLRRVQKL